MFPPGDVRPGGNTFYTVLLATLPDSYILLGTNIRCALLGCARPVSGVSPEKGGRVKELPFMTGARGRGPFLVILFFVSVTVVTIWGTWEGTLPASEEAVLAETAREILVTGDGWTMHFDGEPVRDVSPLPLWFMASCYRFFGTNEFAARLPFVLFAVLTYFITYIIGILSETPCDSDSGWINRARSIGLLSAIMLAASPIFGRAATHVSFSMPNAFFAALVLLGWLSLFECRSGLLLWGLGVAGAIFVAGADGVAIAVSAVIAWAVAGRSRSFGRGWFLFVSAIGLALGGAWLFLNAPPSEGHFFTNPLWSAFAGFVRPLPGAVSGLPGQIKDVWIGNLPWSIVAAAAFIRVIFFRSKDKGVQPVDSMLALFAVILFFLLAFTGPGKTDRLLVILPAVAVLSARELSRWIMGYWNGSLERLWSFNQAMVSLFCLLMLLLLATPLRLHKADVDPIRDVAVMAKQLSPGDGRIGNFRQPYRTQGARLLFYGGKSLEEPLYEPEEVVVALERDPTSIFISSPEDFALLRSPEYTGHELRILYRAGPLLLFGAKQGAE